MLVDNILTFLALTCIYSGTVSFFIKLYISYSKQLNIVAKINNRTLHSKEVPTGAGIVFSSLFVFFIWAAYFLGYLDARIIFYLSISGLFVSLFGFIDDLFNIRASIKFSFQIISSIIFLIALYSVNSKIIIDASTVNIYLLSFASIFLLVWGMNMFNFMDGINGHLSSCSLIIAWSASVLIYLQQGLITDDSVVLFFLGLTCLSFLFFNFRPAITFMGDSGSMFLGFFMCAVILKNFFEGSLNLSIWIILLSYFLGDCVPTTIYRQLFIKKWFLPHRSHAYQNLARILENHSKVTTLAIFYHLFWLFPLSLLCLLLPGKEFLFITISISPVLLFNFLYGPRLSNQ